MPKSFLFVRHAKSSWKDPSLADKDRPLNARGKRDGPFMASYCRAQGLIPDLLISSPAKRAHKTAKYFNEEFSPEKGLVIESDLYFGSESDWEHLINTLDEQVRLPAFFSHNPTITFFANRLGSVTMDNVPTCGVVHLESSAELWSQVSDKNTRLVNYYFPKLIRA